MGRRGNWLSITPEPERELPQAVATLRHSGAAPSGAAARERQEIERLVLRASQRRWLQYLREVIALMEASAGDSRPEVAGARSLAGAVIANHHNLLLAFPGRASRRTAGDRARLAQLDFPVDQ